MIWFNNLGTKLLFGASLEGAYSGQGGYFFLECTECSKQNL